MKLEIEQKFPIDYVDDFLQRLERLGAEEKAAVQQRDTYYNHPARDFRTTDEALRIRRTVDCDGDAAVVTYKGPKRDVEVKTRPEIELPLAEPESWPALLEALGFREVATVSKSRRRFGLERDSFDVELVIDQVEGVGQFAEVEIVADEADMNAARDAIRQLAAELELSEPERRSYLTMLLAGADEA